VAGEPALSFSTKSGSAMGANKGVEMSTELQSDVSFRNVDDHIPLKTLTEVFYVDHLP
jgi:hypothetical protein